MSRIGKDSAGLGPRASDVGRAYPPLATIGRTGATCVGGCMFDPQKPFDDGYVVAVESGCWEWQRTKTRCGYGRVWDGRKSQGAHRLMHMVHNGPIPDGWVVDHLCVNPACVNPAHLRAVTYTINLLESRKQWARGYHFEKGTDGVPSKPSTHCVKCGTEKTVYRWKAGRRGVAQYRRCKPCDAARWRAKKARRDAFKDN